MKVKKKDDVKIIDCPTSYTGFDGQDYFHELAFGEGYKPVPTDYRCCLCGKTFSGYGHSPYPFTDDVRMRCCDECNLTKVLPERARTGKGVWRFGNGYAPRNHIQQ